MLNSDYPLPKSVKPKSAKEEKTNYGLLIAFIVIGLWAGSLIFLLSLNVAKLQELQICFAVLWQTFLYTGLFITAHDAMHGVVFPKNLKINHAVGTIAVFAYGLFSYRSLLKKHILHHKYPASQLDPDFHDGQYKNYFAWYFHFMKGYWNWYRLLGLFVLFHSAHYLLQISEFNLILFWAIPSLLSSIQLFYFGTFLTHREPEEGYTNSHRTQSNSLPIFWSFITCYHFGYHEEHHEYPHVPWWQLPAVRKRLAGDGALVSDAPDMKGEIV